jgi:UDP-N-acetylglucosamine 2-epimerase (non-hydrolysing)
MSESSFILIDSGGIQEEAPTFGIPTVVLRNTTERTEALSAGTAILAGTYENEILACLELMTTEKCLEMAKIKNPYGDGFASQKIVDILQSY